MYKGVLEIDFVENERHKTWLVVPVHVMTCGHPWILVVFKLDLPVQQACYAGSKTFKISLALVNHKNSLLYQLWHNALTSSYNLLSRLKWHLSPWLHVHRLLITWWKGYKILKFFEKRYIKSSSFLFVWFYHQEVSLVVFEKRLLDKVDKRDRDFVMETMKKGPVQLTRLRHPRLLVVQHPLEESK